VTALKNLDLKLIEIIGDLYTSRSVSATAANLDIRQSTVSMALARLRKHFDDPLFVRTSVGMEPTPRGEEIIEVFRSAEFYMRKALESQEVFDPARSTRVFRLCSTDLAQLTILPALLKRLKLIAPSVTVALSQISDRMPERLESGDADLAIGFVQPRAAGFCGQRLFQDRFVCVFGSDHPRIGKTISGNTVSGNTISGKTISMDQFEAEAHIAIATNGTDHSVIEDTLAANGMRRQIGLQVPGFLGLGPILTNTDLIAILPEQLGAYLARSGKIRLAELPVYIPPYSIYQVWHERVMHDAASRWFRKVIAGLFLRATGDTVRNTYRPSAGRTVTSTPLAS
jgi:DNA-binding transcriptional LysR family regulator